MKRLKNLVKYLIGGLLNIFCPNIVSKEEDQHAGRNKRWKKAILFYRSVRAKNRGDTSGAEDTLHDYWQADVSNNFYHLYTKRFNDWFLGPHQELIDQMVVLARDGEYDHLIEVGCGDGRVLEHCAIQIKKITKFTGIDINPMIVDANIIRYADNSALKFITANAREWLPKNTEGSTLLLTYGGVMEYFSAQSLSIIFSDLAHKGNCAVALIEPIDPEHNLSTQTESNIFGAENSFSHNYRYLLEQSGFQIEFEKELELGQVRWMMILATSIN